MWKWITSSPWRTAFLAIAFWIVLYVTLVGLLSLFPPLEAPWQDLRNGIGGSIITLAMTAAFLRGKPEAFRAVGLWWSRKTLPNVFVGLVVGALILCAILALLVTFAALEINARPTIDYPVLLLACAALLPLAFMEEVAFRGYPFQSLCNSYGLWVAQVVTAIAFGMYHVGYGWSVTAAFTGPSVWAFVFGISAAMSRGIAVPTGIHLALNIGQVLVGMKGDIGLWKLSFVAGATAADREMAETIGLALQGSVFACGLLITWWQRHTS